MPHQAFEHFTRRPVQVSLGQTALALLAHLL
jgi:hypothetical protein